MVGWCIAWLTYRSCCPCRTAREGGALGYIAAGWAHNTSYATGAVGAIVLWLWVWRERMQISQTTTAPSSEKRFMRGVVIDGIICAILWGRGLHAGYAIYQGFTDTYFPANTTF